MKILYTIIIFISVLPLFGQELNCRVIIDDARAATQDRQIFRDMEASFEQFLNNRTWSNDTYQPEERINCNIAITIESMDITAFNATVQVQASRPIFGTNYESRVLNFADRDFNFNYVMSQPLEYNDNSFISNITSMLAFYAYIILGVDYDSFAELGGAPFFQRALLLVTNAQQSNRPGWDPMSSNRNRYWLVENYTNQQMVEMRRAMYRYHRHGLDTFHEEPDKSREEVLNALKAAKRIKDINPIAIILISFFDAKTDELVNIFSEGNIQVRRQAYDLLTELDPAKSERYQKIIQN